MATGTSGQDFLINDHNLLEDRIDALEGDDFITIQAPRADLLGVGHIVVHGDAGYDTLVATGYQLLGVDGSGFDGDIGLIANGIEYHVHFTSIEELVVSGGTGGYAGAAPIVTGNSNDQIGVGDALHPVVVRSHGGDDAIFVTGHAPGIDIDAADGDDWIDIQQAILPEGASAPELRGGDGADKLVGSAVGDRLYGGTGGDRLYAGMGDDLLDGGAGGDEMDGGPGDDLYLVDDAGDILAEPPEAGIDTVRTGLATFSLFNTYVENLAATSDAAHDFRGSTADNFITGGAGADLFRMQDGGVDFAVAGAGNDAFLFGRELTNGDRADGGDGTDQLGLQGDYTGARKVILGFITDIEQIVLLAGDDTRFGDPGTAFYSYDIRSHDVNVAAGELLTLDANRLRSGETLTFDGSAETDGRFQLIGGRGADVITGGANADTIRGGLGPDLLKGGGGNDLFQYRSAAEWAGDKVDGGGGSDTLALDGLMSGAGVAFGTAGLKAVERILLAPAAAGAFNGYNLSFGGGNIAAGKTLLVDGSALRAGEGLGLNAFNETLGSLTAFGGAARDVLIGGSQADTLRGGRGGDYLKGNGGADRLVYSGAADSTGIAFDQLAGFDYRVDRIDLPGTVSGWAADVNSGRLAGATFDKDLAAALDAALGASQAVLFRPDSGDFSGRLFAVIDANGDGAYRAGQDYVLEIVAPAVPIAPVTSFFV